MSSNVDVPGMGVSVGAVVRGSGLSPTKENVQMDGDPPSSQVAHSHHATDQIPSHAVKHQNFPDRLPVFVQHGARQAQCAIRVYPIVQNIRACRRVFVQIEDFLNSGLGAC